MDTPGHGGRTADARIRFTRVMAALWLMFTLYETLHPVGWLQHVPFWSFFDAIMAGTDFVQNLVLFAPLGWIAHRAGWPLWRGMVAALCLSASIEFAQQWVPGRTSTAMDIACNTTGAALGWWAATRVGWPRVRMGVAFALLAVFMELHVLNTAWPEPADQVSGVGAWKVPSREMCPGPAHAWTVCLSVPNATDGGARYVRVSAVPDRTYARVQAEDDGLRLTRDDCVNMAFESTMGSPLHLRPPMVIACGVADSTDRVVRLQVDPRLEHERGRGWTPTRAGVWMWPVWPFMEYQPGLLRAMGAMAFVVLAALLAGVPSWILPAGYLLILEVVALLTAMRGPGLWEVGWTGMAWLAGMALVRLDSWWRSRSVAAPNVRA